MVTLINKYNKDVVITVPEVVIGEKYYLIDRNLIKQDYHNDEMYLKKDDWYLIES